MILSSLFRKSILFLLIILVLTGCTSCKEEECSDPTNPECPNYDPCAQWNLPDQNFKIKASGYEALDHDTIWCLSQIEFEVNEFADSVFWIIGSDQTIYEGNSLDFYFGSPHQHIQIRCISYRPDNITCNGQSLRIDTITKTITLVHWPDLPIWSWEFEGSFEDEPETTRQVRFHYEVDAGSPPNLPTGDKYIIGLTASCDNIPCEGILISDYNHRQVNPETTCCSPGIAPGAGYVSIDKSTVYFNYSTASGYRTFHGNRIN